MSRWAAWLPGISSDVLSEAVDCCICFIREMYVFQHDGDLEGSRPQGPKNVHNF